MTVRWQLVTPAEASFLVKFPVRLNERAKYSARYALERGALGFLGENNSLGCRRASPREVGTTYRPDPVVTVCLGADASPSPLASNSFPRLILVCG